MNLIDRIRHTALILRSVSWNTFRVAVRNKIFIALLVVSVALMLFGLAAGAMSLHHEIRVATDLCLFVTTVFGTAMAVYSSISLFFEELEQKTIYTILSKPVHRWQFLAGKYLGTLLTLAMIVVILACTSGLLIIVQNGEITRSFVLAFVLVGFQLAIISATASLFASFSSPVLSGLFAVGVFVLGHLHDQIRHLTDTVDATSAEWLVSGLMLVIPDLAALNIATAVVHDLPVPWSYLGTAAGYTATYAGLTLLAAMFLFHHRDLE